MPVVLRVDQLDGHDDPVSAAADTALEHVDYAEGLRDLRQVVFSRPAIRHDGRAADHLQVVDLRQAGQDIVLDSVGEKGVLLFVAEVFEWKHRNALFAGTGGGWAG